MRAMSTPRTLRLDEADDIFDDAFRNALGFKPDEDKPLETRVTRSIVMSHLTDRMAGRLRALGIPVEIGDHFFWDQREKEVGSYRAKFHMKLQEFIEVADAAAA